MVFYHTKLHIGNVICVIMHTRKILQRGRKLSEISQFLNGQLRTAGYFNLCLTPGHILTTLCCSPAGSRRLGTKAQLKNRAPSLPPSPALIHPWFELGKAINFLCREDWSSRGGGHCSIAFHMLFSNLPTSCPSSFLPFPCCYPAARSCRPDAFSACCSVWLIWWSYGLWQAALLRKHTHTGRQLKDFRYTLGADT